jgi:hypothetical protein
MQRNSRKYRFAAGVLAVSLPAFAAAAQQPATQQPSTRQSVAQQPAANGPAIYQRYAPIDLTGYWVSVVTEDWAQRMIPPVKGDFSGLPLNAAGQKAGNAWDPEQQLAAGEACKAYSAPALLRIPGRLKIGWQDGGNTLRIDTDAGQQTRLLHFTGAEPQGEAGWQGYSAASWEYAGGFDPLRVASPADIPAQARSPVRDRARGRGAPPTTPQGGALKVVTTHLKPGYLRKNGVPYSKDAVLTEYFNVHADPYGADWLVVTSIVHDPAYLLVDYITSTNFKREPDGSKWRPRPCTVQ